VQLIFQLSDSSSLHITNAEWFTPNHHRIQDTGLNPDIVVEPMEGRDAQLQRAIEYLEE
jgi:C-terminal processing protease CtpA/Prc